MTLLLAPALLAPPGTVRAQSGETRHTVVVGGVARSYLLFVPSGYAAGPPLPLVLVFHGGGSRARAMTTHTEFTRVAERSAELWARVDGCDARPELEAPRDSVRDGTRVRARRWTGCKDGREVVLYTIEGGGHTWPGGPPVGPRVGRVTGELDATEVIWAFFAAHPRS